MVFTETALRGAFLVEPEAHVDERGFFARTWAAAEFESRGLNPRLAECSASFNDRRGTLRGMHYQAEPFAEAKLVRCTHGSVCDVMIDLRDGSSTFGQWVAIELSASNRRMLFVPEGVAHGFLTLEDRTELFYQISAPYSPAHVRGVRWNDPAFGITWPLEPVVMSARDRAYPDFRR
jgi:dTDP-4-dehydrorhamnose 3,5-epimerase